MVLQREQRRISEQRKDYMEGRFPSVFKTGITHSMANFDITELPHKKTEDDFEYQTYTTTTSTNIFIEGYSDPDGPDFVP
jgi:hypothetical protein